MKLWIDRELIKMLNRLGRVLCKQFGYHYNNLGLMWSTDGWYKTTAGYCDVLNKEIKINLRKSPKRFYRIEDLIDTLIHEIAHIEDDADGPEHPMAWKKRFLKMKRWAKKHIYA